MNNLEWSILAALGTGVVLTGVSWFRDGRERAKGAMAVTERLSHIYELVLTGLSRHGGAEPPLVPAGADRSLVTGSEAFLAGRYRDYLVAHRRAVPAWAWINRLAHGSLTDVEDLAGRVAVAGGPEAVVAAIAARMLDAIRAGEVTLASIQQQTLVPLETELAGDSRTPMSADEVGRILLDALAAWGMVPPVDLD